MQVNPPGPGQGALPDNSIPSTCSIILRPGNNRKDNIRTIWTSLIGIGCSVSSSHEWCCRAKSLLEHWLLSAYWNFYCKTAHNCTEVSVVTSLPSPKNIDKEGLSSNSSRWSLHAVGQLTKYTQSGLTFSWVLSGSVQFKYRSREWKVTN